MPRIDTWRSITPHSLPSVGIIRKVSLRIRPTCRFFNPSILAGLSCMSMHRMIEAVSCIFMYCYLLFETVWFITGIIQSNLILILVARHIWYYKLGYNIAERTWNQRKAISDTFCNHWCAKHTHIIRQPREAASTILLWDIRLGGINPNKMHLLLLLSDRDQE